MRHLHVAAEGTCTSRAAWKSSTGTQHKSAHRPPWRIPNAMLFLPLMCKPPTKEPCILQVVLFFFLFFFSHSRLQTRDLCQKKVWHPFCNVSVAQRMNTQDGEGCYFNLHAIATRFGWLTQNVCDTYLNGKCSVFVRQTILWQLAFCHSPK